MIEFRPSTENKEVPKISDFIYSPVNYLTFDHRITDLNDIEKDTGEIEPTKNKKIYLAIIALLLLINGIALYLLYKENAQKKEKTTVIEYNQAFVEVTNSDSSHYILSDTEGKLVAILNKSDSDSLLKNSVKMTRFDFSRTKAKHSTPWFDGLVDAFAFLIMGIVIGALLLRFIVKTVQRKD